MAGTSLPNNPSLTGLLGLVLALSPLNAMSAADSTPSPTGRSPIRASTAAERGFSRSALARMRPIGSVTRPQRASAPAASVATPCPQKRRPTQ
jgi:hypothetical protein